MRFLLLAIIFLSFSAVSKNVLRTISSSFASLSLLSHFNDHSEKFDHLSL
jgi:hypothetical protein